MRDKWNYDREVTVINVDGAVSLGDQVDEWDPVVVSCHLGHEIGQR